MLVSAINNPNSAIAKRASQFGLALKASPPLLERSHQIIFLCGANRSTNEPSARRTAIKSFIESISSQFKVVYAEEAFEVLRLLGHVKNALDLEHEISKIADRVVIILESPSAFCELGAFSHESLRSNLIIINNQKFRTEKSFINTGPLTAVEEAGAPVLWYSMNDHGIETVDGIGATYAAVAEALAPKLGRATRISTQINDPAKNKTSIYLVHDLVLLSGPVTYEELIEFVKTLFGNHPYDNVRNLIGILRAADLIHRHTVDGKVFFSATTSKFFLRYSHSTAGLMASFKTYHLKHHPMRISHG